MVTVLVIVAGILTASFQVAESNMHDALRECAARHHAVCIVDDPLR